MTVKNHLERVFAKLGVETRTAAANMAMSRIRQLHPRAFRPLDPVLIAQEAIKYIVFEWGLLC